MPFRYNRAEILEQLYEADQEFSEVGSDELTLAKACIAMASADRIVKTVKNSDTLDDELLEKAFEVRQTARKRWRAAESIGLTSFDEVDGLYERVIEAYLQYDRIFTANAKMITKVGDLLSGDSDAPKASLENFIECFEYLEAPDTAICCFTYLEENPSGDMSLDSLEGVLDNSLAPALLPLVKLGILPDNDPNVMAYEYVSDDIENNLSRFLKQYPALGGLVLKLHEKSACSLGTHDGVLFGLRLALNKEVRKRVIGKFRHQSSQIRELVLAKARSQAQFMLRYEAAVRESGKTCYKDKKRGKPLQLKASAEMHKIIEEFLCISMDFPIVETLQVQQSITKSYADFTEAPSVDYMTEINASMDLYPAIVLEDDAPEAESLYSGEAEVSVAEASERSQVSLHSEQAADKTSATIRAEKVVVSFVAKLLGSLLAATGLVLSFFTAIGVMVGEPEHRIVGFIVAGAFFGVAWFGYRMAQSSTNKDSETQLPKDVVAPN